MARRGLQGTPAARRLLGYGAWLPGIHALLRDAFRDVRDAAIHRSHRVHQEPALGLTPTAPRRPPPPTRGWNRGRGHEGRGIGLLHKLQAYQLQDMGLDTVDANLDLGLPADARHYGTATQILRDLGVASVRLLTNNPAKVTNLEHYGIPVTERVPLTPHPNDHNLGYLLTKRDRMGHHLPDLHDHEPVTVDQGGPA